MRRYRHSDIKKCLITRTIVLLSLFFLYCFPSKGLAQTGESTVQTLVNMGFENVGVAEDGEERVYVLQNSAYRLQGVGIGKALDVIQQEGLPEGKKCRVIVLDNNVPQISLTYSPLAESDSLEVQRKDWNVSYDLGDGWKKVRKVKAKNSSLFKVDILVYPKLVFKNLIITQIYQYCLDFCPTVEISFWKGSKLTLQMTVPVANDGYRYERENVRWGHLMLEQGFRLPYNIFGRAVVGVFNQRTYGAELTLSRPFKDERFSVEAKFGVVQLGYFHDLTTFKYDKTTKWYASVGGDFFWPQFNTQFRVRGEHYLKDDYGIRGDMIRHFRYASIGFYLENSSKYRYNGGFRIAVALPPYKHKRKGYIPRISTGSGMGIAYNAGNERNGYLMPSTVQGGVMLKYCQYNPYFIKSEIVN